MERCRGMGTCFVAVRRVVRVLAISGGERVVLVGDWVRGQVVGLAAQAVQKVEKTASVSVY